MKILGKALVFALLVLPVAASAAAQTSAPADASRAVNINKASAEQLSLLPRIGPAIAERIVEFRKENGDFKQPQDVMLVRGIGEKLYAMIQPYVRVSGETTLKEKLKAPKMPPPSGGKGGGDDTGKTDDNPAND